MTATAALRPVASDPAVDLRLASVHLRMGQLGLARAALEALAGSGDLDEEGLLALAEARWRTGDLTGAGDAAEAYLASGGDAPMALVISAEAIAAAGRPGEARRYADRVLERDDVALDRLFAGMPRSAVWPADPADAAQATTSTLFGGEPGPRSRRGASDSGRRDGHGSEHHAPTAAIWDGEQADAEELPEPSDELEAGRAALRHERRAEAALRFALVLRQAPELAPAVLTATEPRAARSPEVEIVRGDAFRIVGHELDARRAYLAAAAEIGPAPGGLAAPIDGADQDPTNDHEETT